MMTDEPNKEEEEYKIVEPKRDNSQTIEVKVLKTKGAVVAIMTKLILAKGEDLDVDNIFNVINGLGEPVCVLTNSIPCKNPHCMSCNMMHFYDEKADHVLSLVSDKLGEKALGQCRKKFSDERKKAIDEMMEHVMRIVEDRKNE